MQPVNKILFAYPVRYKPEMTNEECCIPVEHFSGIKSGTSMNIIVTAGLMINIIEGIFINVVINGPESSNDNLEIVENGRINNLRTHIFPNNQGVFLTSMVLENTLFDESGIYEITVQLYGSDGSGDKSDIPLDTYKSYFYTSLSGAA